MLFPFSEALARSFEDEQIIALVQNYLNLPPHNVHYEGFVRLTISQLYRRSKKNGSEGNSQALKVRQLEKTAKNDKIAALVEEYLITKS